jgi:gas vesicle protein
VSDRNGGLGSFVLGIAVGAVLGLLVAPLAGDEFKDEVGRRVRSLRDLAVEKAEQLGELVTEATGADEPARRIAPPRKRRRSRRPKLHA